MSNDGRDGKSPPTRPTIVEFGRQDRERLVFCQKAAEAILNAYPSSIVPNEKIYISTLCEAFMGMAESVVKGVSNMRTGIVTKCKWPPSIAEVVEFAEGVKAAGTHQYAVKHNFWADAHNFARQWFTEKTDPNLIGRAQIEGWTDALFRHVESFHHAWSVRGHSLRLDQIWMDSDDCDYYQARARTYRAADKWHAENPGKFAKEKAQGKTT